MWGKKKKTISKRERRIFTLLVSTTKNIFFIKNKIDSIRIFFNLFLWCCLEKLEKKTPRKKENVFLFLPVEKKSSRIFTPLASTG